MKSNVWAPLFVLLALIIVSSILVARVGGVHYHSEADDRYYLEFMTRVGSDGPAVFPRFFREWVGDEQHWIFPPPSRLGFILVSAAWSKIFGATYQALSYLSMASFLALIVVQYRYATRFFGRERGAWISALTAFSPLLMGSSLQALTDSLITLCMALSVWLFLALVEEPGSKRARVLFVIAFTCAILVKELSVLLAVPFTAFVLIERSWRKTALDLRQFALMLVAPPLVCGGLYLLAAGDVRLLVRTLSIVLGSPKSNTYAVQFGSGPWDRYIIDYLLFTVWPTLLAIGFFGALLWRLKQGEYQRELVFFALIPTCLIFVFSFFTKNIRYMMILELPITVFAVAMLDELLRSKRRALSTAACTAAVVVLCWLDWQSYELFYARYQAYDPISLMLLGARGLLPLSAP